VRLDANVPREVLGPHLDRDITTKLGITRAKDDSHAPRAKASGYPASA